MSVITSLQIGQNKLEITKCIPDWDRGGSKIITFPYTALYDGLIIIQCKSAGAYTDEFYVYINNTQIMSLCMQYTSSNSGRDSFCVPVHKNDTVNVDVKGNSASLDYDRCYFYRYK